MYKLATRFLTVVLGVLLVSKLVPGVHVDGLYVAFIVALVLGVCNIIVRPLLVLLTLPITIVTFGLFLLVLNAGIFWFVGDVVDGFSVSGFVPALIGSFIISTLSWLAQKLTD